jgi:hypothetical protein
MIGMDRVRSRMAASRDLGLLLKRIGLAAHVSDAKVQLRSFDRRS